MTPNDADVRAALERVLGAEGFASAGRLSRLLRFLVEEAIAGRGDRLKEYVVGVEVFDRPEGYDPRTDSIVRVEARRLRAKLGEYYAGPGARDEVVIGIPRGGYMPVFSGREAAAATAGAGEARSPLGSFRPRSVIAAAIGALVIVMFVMAPRRAAPARVSAETSSPTVRIAVMPFEVFTMDPDVSMLSARVTDGVTAALARIDTVSVASRTSAEAAAGAGQPVRDIARTLGADFIMEGSVVVETGRVKVSARLVDTAVDRKIWVGEYDSAPADLAGLHARIAREAAALASTHVRQR